MFGKVALSDAMAGAERTPRARRTPHEPYFSASHPSFVIDRPRALDEISVVQRANFYSTLRWKITLPTRHSVTSRNELNSLCCNKSGKSYSTLKRDPRYSTLKCQIFARFAFVFLSGCAPYPLGLRFFRLCTLPRASSVPGCGAMAAIRSRRPLPLRFSHGRWDTRAVARAHS
jgi:hypothetical protein